MAERAAPAMQGGPAQEQSIGPLTKLVLNFRLLALAITSFSLVSGEGTPSAQFAVLLVLAGVISIVPLLLWERVGHVLMRHPAFLVVDLLLAMTILAITGSSSPFFYFTIGTAMLSGVLYGWRGSLVMAPWLLAGYWAGLDVRSDALGNGLGTFQTLVGIPSIYPMAAAAGAAVRSLVLRRVAAEHALAESAQVAAVERERARISREMHDSLAKTLHGIALQASALVKWMTRDPQRAATEARSLAGAAEVAATQGRELIQDLRNDLLDLPLSVAVRDYVDGWSETSGIASVTDVSDTSDVSPGARWELFSVLKEALRNVERHARADKVRVGLRRREEWIEMDVQDDGAGFGVPTDLRTLVSNGHFGLVGMTERAEAVGGSLQIDSIPGSGTTVIARVPAQPDEDRRAEPAGGVR